MAATKTKKKSASSDRHKTEETAQRLKGLRLLGEVITWDASGPHPFSKVRQALADAGLDEKAAREFLPSTAFARAVRKMSDEGVVDHLKEEGSVITFQLSTRVIQTDPKDGEDEVAYKKRTRLRLDKDAGTIACPDSALKKRAQDELDKCLAERTTADVTNIVQRLFRREADLFSLREAGGVYFVPQHHAPFTAKVQEFLTTLGGRLNRLPVPAGTEQGDASVRDAVAGGIREIIADHSQAVEGLTMHTRPDVLAAAAERIKQTRVKVEAYAHYLASRREELLEALEESAARLEARKLELVEERKNAPPEELGVDEFGSRLNGSGDLARANACLSKKTPKTVNEIVDEIGFRGNFRGKFYNHFNALVAKGLVVKTKDGYLLPKE